MFKNEDADVDPGMAELYAETHALMRVVESVRAAEGPGPIGELYTEYGRRIHHDESFEFDPADALTAVGLDPTHAAAADDADRWDPTLRASLADALALTGDDVGTPIIAFDIDGEWRGYFGPVITPAPTGDDALRLWDGMVAIASVPGLYELKRHREHGPEFGPRP